MCLNSNKLSQCISIAFCGLFLLSGCTESRKPADDDAVPNNHVVIPNQPNFAPRVVQPERKEITFNVPPLLNTLDHNDADSFVECVAWSPDNRILATGSWDGRIRLWDVSTNQIIGVHGSYVASIDTVKFSPCGKLLAWSTAAHRGKPPMVKLWDIATQKEKASFNYSGARVRSLLFIDGGETLVVGDWGGGVALWDTKTCSKRKQFGTGTIIESMSVSNDEKLLAVGSQKFFDDGPLLTVRYLSTGKPTSAAIPHQSDSVFTVAFAPDGKSFASGGHVSVVSLWDVETGKKNMEFAHGGWTYALTFMQNGKTLAIAGKDGTVSFWDTSTGKQLARLRHSRFDELAIDLASNGRTLATADTRSVKLWDVTAFVEKK